jgi:hypothetical protein
MSAVNTINYKMKKIAKFNDRIYSNCVIFNILFILIFPLTYFGQESTKSFANFANHTHPNILSKTQNQNDEWAADVRREWLIDTATLSNICGKQKIVIQCGFLTSHYSTGYLVLILDKKNKSPIVCIKPRWGSRIDSAELDPTNPEQVKRFAHNLIKWASEVKITKDGIFQLASPIPGDIAHSGQIGGMFFVVEIADTDTGLIVQHKGNYREKLPEGELFNLIAWTLHHANAWPQDAVTEMFEIGFSPLPLVGDFMIKND